MSKEVVLKEISECIDYLYENNTYYKGKLKKKGEIELDNVFSSMEDSIKNISNKDVVDLVTKEVDRLKGERGKVLMRKYSMLFSDSVLIKVGFKKQKKK